MSAGKRKTANARTLQQPLHPGPTTPIVTTPTDAQPQTGTRAPQAAADPQQSIDRVRAKRHARRPI